MRRIFGLLTALLLALSSILPLSVIRVNAKQYGWVPADTEYFLQRGYSEMPDAIRIELAYTAGMHAYSDESVFGDPDHYAKHSEVIELKRGVPKTWRFTNLYIDMWDYYESELYTQDISHEPSEYPFVSWDEYPDDFGEYLGLDHNQAPAVQNGWEVSRRVYYGTIDFLLEDRLSFDMDLTLSHTQNYSGEPDRTIRNQGFALERPYLDDPLLYVYSDHQQTDLYFRLLELHYSETPAAPAPTPVTIHTDAKPDSGETGFSIPAAIAGFLTLGGAALWLKNRSKKKPAQTTRKKQKQDEEPEEEELPKFEMRVYKEFGDKIHSGDTKAVYAKIVRITKEGNELDQDEYTRMIRIQSGSFLQVRKQEFMDHYMAAAVYAPLSNDAPQYGNIIFNFRSYLKVDMRFRIGGCIIITDPATGAETVYHETDAGYWLSLDGSRVLDTERVAEWMEQRRKDRAYMDQQNINLAEGKTAFDRELERIRQEYIDEANRIDQETKTKLHNLKKFGISELSDEYKREIIERDMRLAENEGAAASRRAAIYHMYYYGAYATKYATDKTFDIIGSKGGVVGKVGKALYTIAVDQTGAITEAVIQGKSGKEIAKEMLKAGMDSGLSIGKDLVESVPAKYVTIIGGNTAVATAKAAVDGKRGKALLKEGLVGTAKGTFEFSVDQVGENLKTLVGAGDSQFIADDAGNLTHLYLDEKEIMVNAAGDLANGVYQTAEEAMDDWRETHQYK